MPGQLFNKRLRAHKDIDGFMANASDKDQRNFADYLKYYRSEGGYQAVTPAPASLRKSLSSDALNLFGKLVKKAKKFTRKASSIPGASKLTQLGEKFYSKCIEYITDLIEKSGKGP